MSRDLPKGRDEQSIQKSGKSWFQTKGSTKALKGLSGPPGIARKSVWPEWVKERMIGDEVKEHQDSTDVTQVERFKCFK